jgi:hypothetical protein
MRLVAIVWLAVVLQGCARTEEEKQAAKREQAETTFVEAVASSPLATVRASLEQDRTLANAFRTGHDRRRRAEAALTAAVTHEHARHDGAAARVRRGPEPGSDNGDSPWLAIGDKDRANKVALLLERARIQRGSTAKAPPSTSRFHTKRCF